MGTDLVLYGGDKSGPCVCSTGPGDWRWSNITPSGTAPPDRRFHSATVLGKHLTMFGGSSLADGNELADVFWLTRSADGSYTWGWPHSQTPYIR